MKRKLIDRKSWWAFAALNLINEVSVRSHFARYEVEGRENLPNGSFILIANHSTRWDGPSVQHVLGRPSNYMVSPNELRGVQGILLRGIGAFPADPRANLLEHMRKQARKGEPIVIFPEGNVFYDGTTHSFKQGAARIALLCAEAGLDVPLVPVALSYSKTKPEVVRVKIGEPIDVRDRLNSYKADAPNAVRQLTTQLHREVCYLRAQLGSRADYETLYGTKPVRAWVTRPVASAAEKVSA